jgi:hypothetical protein
VSSDVHVAPEEEVILEIHGVALLGGLADLVESIHVELPDEGRDVLVPEVVGQYPLL